MTPDDPTRDPSEAALDAGLAAAFGGDTTHLRSPSADPEAGTVIAGRYKLSEKIGEGGMGGVWVANQTEPVKRKVAVKLIKAGMDSKAVLARFDAERQALAVMDHPNIAKVLDGGLHDGRPYFVMELVKGVPITTFCDARKLTPAQRLELFVPVCQSIQHAHQKGVIHRDIKPSNVLVALYDDRPVVKVIDFGIAKATGAALTEHTLETGFGAVVGTPAYMSPEQASLNNLDIDTRSDVYALGVLLYELLTGSPPFSGHELRKKGVLEMLRVVREEEPPKPSVKLSTADALPTLSANRGTEPKKLTGLLRNELDWIVMKALEKDRTRRYDTANGFAADVTRYLAGEPVQAHPPSAGYRLKKFVRKHRVQVIAASLVLLTLVAGVIGTAWQAIRAESARADEATQRGLAEANERTATAAEQRTKLALDGADKLLDLQMETGRRVNRPLTPEETEYMAGLLAQFESLTQSETGPAQAEAFTRLASVQSHLGSVPDMERSYAAAIRILIEQVAADPADANANRVRVAKVREKLARAYRFVGEVVHAHKVRATLELAAADWLIAADADPQNPTPLVERARVLTAVKSVPKSLLKPPTPNDDLPLLRSLVECRSRLVALRPQELQYHSQLSSDFVQLLQLSRVNSSPEQFLADVRAAFRAAVRFVAAGGGDHAVPHGSGSMYFWNSYETLGLRFSRYGEGGREGALVQLESLLRACTASRIQSGPASSEEVFRRAISDGWSELRKELPGRHAAAIELLLKIGEAQAVERDTNGKQKNRSAALYAEAVALARRKDCDLPPAFLKVRWVGIGVRGEIAESPAGVTAEEYVWLRRLAALEMNNDHCSEALRQEFTDRPERPVSPAFRQWLVTAYIKAVFFNLPLSGRINAAQLARLAVTEFTRYKAQVPQDEAYFLFAEAYATDLQKMSTRLQEVGDTTTSRAIALTRLEFLEQLPEAPDKFPVNVAVRATRAFDRGNLRMEFERWTEALADYRLALKLLRENTAVGISPEVSPVAHFRSGMCLLRLGKEAEADAAFDEAIRLRRAEPSKLPALGSGRPAVPWSAVVAEYDRAAQNESVGRWDEAIKWATRALGTLDENGEVYPPVEVKKYRLDLHAMRARCLRAKADYPAAAKEWDAAKGCALPIQMRWFHIQSCGTYALVGRSAEVAERLGELLPDATLTADELYDIACGFSLCAGDAKVEKTVAVRHQGRAMEALQRAVKAGFNDHAHMKTDTDLDPLRERADFKTLLADPEKKFPPEKK